MKIGVFVGSFNPVHLGHIKIVNHLLEKYLDRVIIVPTGNYWNKQDLIPTQDRIHMLKYYENERIIIDTENNHLPYTYQVLNQIKYQYKNDDIYLIIGADNIINFDKWKEYQTILQYHMIIINRENVDIQFYLNQLNKKDRYIITETLPNMVISSTYIRENIKKGHNEILKNKIGSEVLNYIQQNHLYQ